MATTDLLQMETNSSSTNSLARSKKLPPPPLCLPASKDDENTLNSNKKREQKKSSNNCCLSSSAAEDCPHKSIPYVLPVSQRPQILDTLMTSSSTLLVPPPSESKHKKFHNVAYTNRMNLFKQRLSSSKVTINDTEWINFMRLVIRQPLERELKSLLDNYKITYFDRINAPNTNDDTIRSSLCAMAHEALATYSSSSLSSSQTMDDSSTNVSSPMQENINNNNGNAKRKRKTTAINSLSISTPVSINSQTKFVISVIVPGKYDNQTNGNKTTLQQQQQKQFQKKYSHLFKYIPDKEEHEYLTREGRWKSSLNSSSRSSYNNSICLMLYDEVISYMDEYDLELSGISIDNSFTIPEWMLEHINSSI